MTKFLSELITDKTPILDLTKCNNVTSEEKYKVLDLECGFAEKYIRYIYYLDNIWYYFKGDINNGGYPFYILDELMGSHLAKKCNLQAVSYQVAKVKSKLPCKNNEQYGIASINFKKQEFAYTTFNKIANNEIFLNDIDKIKYLKNFCIDIENEKIFQKHLFQLFALDIYMLQKDRCNLNLQFQKNKITNQFDIAPLYDFSNCLPNIGMAGLDQLKNIIINLNELTIRSLCREYPQFKEELSFWLEQSMKDTWNEICEEYHFNQECSAYERIKDYYEIKDESVKKNIKQIIKDVQRTKSVV